MKKQGKPRVKEIIFSTMPPLRLKQDSDSALANVVPRSSPSYFEQPHSGLRAIHFHSRAKVSYIRQILDPSHELSCIMGHAGPVYGSELALIRAAMDYCIFLRNHYTLMRFFLLKKCSKFIFDVKNNFSLQNQVVSSILIIPLVR